MKLKCLRGPLEGQEFALDPGRTYILGREPNVADTEAIELPSLTVSTEHADIHFENGSWLIQDRNSRNGIRLNRKKIHQGDLRSGDELDIGEFRFFLEDDAANEVLQEWDVQDYPVPELTPTQRPPQTPVVSKRNEEESKGVFSKLRSLYDKLEFQIKLFVGMLLVASAAHWLIVSPFIEESGRRLFNESVGLARQVTRNLGQQYAKAIAERFYHLIDCERFRKDRLADGLTIPNVYLLDADSNILCPLGSKMSGVNFLEKVKAENRLLHNCFDSLIGDTSSSCRLASPVYYQLENETSSKLVGYAVVDFLPDHVHRAMQKFQSLRWQTWLLSLLCLLGFAFLVRSWVQSALKGLTDQVYLLFTGTAQKVDSLPSFATFDPLVEEINRLITKINQGVSSESKLQDQEASFLQSILQQVLVLEERAIMAIDRDNNIIGMSAYVPEIIPVQDDHLNLHLSEAIADPHLQGELLSFTNELSTSGEVIDKPLSLSDRVVHARGMPIYLDDVYVASLILF